MTDDQQLRTHMVDICRRMNSSGINQGTAGNLSARTEHGFLITPTSHDTVVLSLTALDRETAYLSASTRSPGNRPPISSRPAARSASIRDSTVW